MGDDELKVYGRLRKDSNFINQLVDLYKELQQANMTCSGFAAFGSA